MNNEIEDKFFKINKDNCENFARINIDSSEISLDTLQDIDSAGIQTILFLASKGCKFVSIPQEIQDKFNISGVSEHLVT